MWIKVILMTKINNLNINQIQCQLVSCDRLFIDIKQIRQFFSGVAI